MIYNDSFAGVPVGTTPTYCGVNLAKYSGTTDYEFERVQQDSETDSDDDVKQDMEAMMYINPIVKEKLRFIPNTHTYAN